MKINHLNHFDVPQKRPRGERGGRLRNAGLHLGDLVHVRNCFGFHHCFGSSACPRFFGHHMGNFIALRLVDVRGVEALWP